MWILGGKVLLFSGMDSVKIYTSPAQFYSIVDHWI